MDARSSDAEPEPAASLASIVEKASSEARRVLADRCPEAIIRFTVKIKPFSGNSKNWMALYRGGSLFGSKGPIFWINERCLEVASELGVPPHRFVEMTCDSILHEYGHVIVEWAERFAPDLAVLIRERFPDEEDFAEGFALTLNGNRLHSSNDIFELCDSFADRLRSFCSERLVQPKHPKPLRLDRAILQRLQAEGETAAGQDLAGGVMRGAQAAAEAAGYDSSTLEAFAFRVAYDRAYWSPSAETPPRGRR